MDSRLKRLLTIDSEKKLSKGFDDYKKRVEREIIKNDSSYDDYRKSREFHRLRAVREIEEIRSERNERVKMMLDEVSSKIDKRKEELMAACEMLDIEGVKEFKKDQIAQDALRNRLIGYLEEDWSQYGAESPGDSTEVSEESEGDGMASEEFSMEGVGEYFDHSGVFPPEWYGSGIHDFEDWSQGTLSDTRDMPTLEEEEHQRIDLEPESKVKFQRNDKGIGHQVKPRSVDIEDQVFKTVEDHGVYNRNFKTRGIVEKDGNNAKFRVLNRDGQKVKSEGIGGEYGHVKKTPGGDGQYVKFQETDLTSSENLRLKGNEKADGQMFKAQGIDEEDVRKDKFLGVNVKKIQNSKAGGIVEKDGNNVKSRIANGQDDQEVKRDGIDGEYGQVVKTPGMSQEDDNDVKFRGVDLTDDQDLRFEGNENEDGQMFKTQRIYKDVGKVKFQGID